MSRSIFTHQTKKLHPVYEPAIQMLRQKAHLLMEQAYDAECRGQVNRTERFTAQASALSRAAGFLADCPADLSLHAGAEDIARN
ncbi:MAG: hypothetical protein RL015_2211 [Verrucomicrobiota bacterium]|jgi:hypothetical protein